jgi:hypothetical protein
MLSLPYISDTTVHKMVSSNIVDTATGSQCPFAVAIESKFLLQRTYQLTNIAFIEGQRNEL